MERRRKAALRAQKPEPESRKGGGGKLSTDLYKKFKPTKAAEDWNEADSAHFFGFSMGSSGGISLANSQLALRHSSPPSFASKVGCFSPPSTLCVYTSLNFL